MPRYKLSPEERAAEKERKEKLYILQSESIWNGKMRSSECGLAKMRVQSFGFRC